MFALKMIKIPSNKIQKPNPYSPSIPYTLPQHNFE